MSSSNRRAKCARAERQAVGRDPDVLREQPPQVTGGHAQAGAELRFAAAVQRPARIIRTARHASSGLLVQAIC